MAISTFANPASNEFEIVGKGIVTEASAPTAGNSEVTEVDHNLGYVPLIIAFATTVSENAYVPLPSFSTDSGGNIDQWLSVGSITSTTIFFVHSERTTDGEVFSYRYYLLRERAS